MNIMNMIYKNNILNSEMKLILSNSGLLTNYFPIIFISFNTHLILFSFPISLLLLTNTIFFLFYRVVSKSSSNFLDFTDYSDTLSSDFPRKIFSSQFILYHLQYSQLNFLELYHSLSNLNFFAYIILYHYDNVLIMRNKLATDYLIHSFPNISSDSCITNACFYQCFLIKFSINLAAFSLFN